MISLLFSGQTGMDGSDKPKSLLTLWLVTLFLLQQEAIVDVLFTTFVCGL